MLCTNPHKYHLYQLPDVEQPQPVYDATNPNVIVLWPLFHIDRHDGADIADGTLGHHAMRGAIWSRHSFLRYSDAIQEGVALKFYIEERCLDAVAPILEANHFDVASDVILFDGTRLEGEPATHFGKKLAVFSDESFRDFDWVCLVDMDLFLSSVHGQSVTCSLFNYLQKRKPCLGAVAGWNLHEYDMYARTQPTIADMHWHYYLLDKQKATREDMVAAWLERAKTLVSPDILNRYVSTTLSFPDVHGSIYFYPAKHMHEMYPERCEWIERAGQLLQDDEAVFSLYAMQWPFFSLAHELHIPFIKNLESLLYGRLLAEERSGGFYFSHIGGFEHELVWRHDNGMPLPADVDMRAMPVAHRDLELR